TLVGPSPVTSIVVNPSDTRLAVGYEALAGEDATVLVWDLRTGEAVGRLATPGISASVLWSPDGDLLVAVGWFWEQGRDMPITVWDADSWTEVSSFVVPLSEQPLESGPVEFVHETVLAVAQLEQVGFYEVTTGQRIEVLDVPGLVPDLGVDLNGGRLVVEGSEGTQVWDIESQSMLWSGEMGASRAVDPNRGWMAVGGFDAVVTIFDLADGSQVMTLAGHTGAILDVAFDPSRDRLYSTAGDGETRVWDIGPGGPAGAGVIPIEEGGALWVSPDGNELAIANEGSLTRYDSTTGARLGSIDGYSDWWLQAPISSDWRLVAMAEIGFIRGERPALPEVWARDLVTGERLHQVPPCAWPEAFSSDGSMLVLDGVDLFVRGVQCQPADTPNEIDHRSRVVDTITGEVLLDLENRALLRALFNPGGVFEPDRYLAIRSWDPVHFETVELHDMTTGTQVARLDIEGQEPLTLAFDPSGRYLAVGGQHSDASVFDVKALVDGAMVEEAVMMYGEVGSGGVAEIALGPGGILATSAHDPHIRLWDIHTGELVRELDGGPYTAVAFTPEGDFLYVDGNDEVGFSVRKLLLDTDRLVELAKTRVTRDLTAEECNRYRLDPATCS
ncbi:MAG: WD40 repeat domain-containing protein, partial [Acidimicrobiia bacterium]